MSSITEQFSAVTKSQLEAQFHILNVLASTTVDSAEKVIALNLNTAKNSVEKTSAAAKQLLAAKDPQEFLSLSTAQQPSFEPLLAYGRELFGIATSAQNQLIQTARNSFKQAADLAATKTPPALAAAVSAAVNAINEPIAEEAAPKAPKAKPAAAPVEPEAPVEVKADIQPADVDPEAKPPKAKVKAAPAAGKQIEMLGKPKK